MFMNEQAYICVHRHTHSHTHTFSKQGMGHMPEIPAVGSLRKKTVINVKPVWAVYWAVW